MAVLVARLDVVRISRARLVALAAWTAFPVTLMLGSVVHDGVPRGLAVIHAGDWLVKLRLITVMLAHSRRRSHRRTHDSAARATGSH